MKKVGLVGKGYNYTIIKELIGSQNVIIMINTEIDTKDLAVKALSEISNIIDDEFLPDNINKSVCSSTRKKGKKLKIGKEQNFIKNNIEVI